MRFLLIHGSWHGAWCWHKVTARLRSLGHAVSTPDLPGRGADCTQPIFIGMKTMLNRLRKTLPVGERTTVVVHSRYGVVASQLAETIPDRIARTIYLASFMLPNDAAVITYSRKDQGSTINQFVDVNRLGAWDWLRAEAHRDLLYHDCTDDDATLATGLLRREPSRPALAKTALTDDRYGRVPRAYIRLTEDRAVSPFLQDKLINETGADRVESIAASHSAYFSKPDELAGKILTLSQD